MLYCSQLWRPQLIKNITILEHVQRRATKYILNDYTSSYKSRLQQLQMLPLMYVYELNDMMFLIKSLKYPTANFNIRQYISFTSSNTRSGDHLKLVHSRTTSALHHHFYSCMFHSKNGRKWWTYYHLLLEGFYSNKILLQKWMEMTHFPMKWPKLVIIIHIWIVLIFHSWMILFIVKQSSIFGLF